MNVWYVYHIFCEILRHNLILMTIVTCDPAKNTMTVSYVETLITLYMLFNNNNNNNNKLELGCHPVAVAILHVYKI